MGFVPGNLLADDLFLRRRGDGEIQLIAEQPESRDIEPTLERGLSRRLVVRARRDMRRHHTGRIAVARPGLNQLALVGIGIVAGPDLREIAEHPEVKPIAA